ncbi:hypothetical protein ACG74X_00220 [Marivita sp. S0852]|uniref:hypothetical protein n=1 Tax=Marivita sp. S0852 TaxID=3373893 RepID=UPI0039827C87
MWRVWIVLGVTVSACAQFPDVDAALAKGNSDAEYPELLPFEALLSAEDPKLPDTEDAALQARADDLRRRAEGLRPAVIDRDTRERMEDGVQQP